MFLTQPLTIATFGLITQVTYVVFQNNLEKNASVFIRLPLKAFHHFV
jgi:hypothetical protein